jgi:D-glycero-D-manno-heptose 1,7-bisphosphate phosphatase
MENTVPNKAQPFVLMDRDGVINRRVLGGHVTHWRQFEFLPRALDALRLFAENGYASLVISDQACVGLKTLSVLDLEMITHRFLMEVALAGGNITQVYYCVHATEERCSCRRPQPGLIRRAQLDYGFTPQDTYFVGDAREGIEASAGAGCPSILLRREAFLERREPGEGLASNLYEAAQMIIARQRREDSWMQSPSAADGRLRSTYAVNH